jgi:hypothetical protein
MTTSTRRTIVLLALGLGLIGCEGSLPPLAPSPVQPPALHVTGDQLTGNVYDTARRPLADARIEVLDGPEAGLLTTSDSLGRFSLPGTFDDTTRFRASKDGYVAAIATRNFCAQCNIHRWWINLVLDLVAAPVNIAGEYTLTIVASGACSALPADFRTRTYTASVVPAPGRPNTSFDVKVSGAQPGLVEQVAPNTYLAFGGWFGASVTDVSTIVAPLDAFIDYCVTPSEMGPVYSCGPGQFVEHAECTSTTHQLLLRRR